MSKPIIVGYDPATADRAPVNFGVAAARFTGAPLIIASVSAAGRPAGRGAARRGSRRRLPRTPSTEAKRELEPEGSRSCVAS